MPSVNEPLAEHYPLTPAEAAVVALVALGKSDAEIAADLETTEAAVHSCLRRFRERTGLAGRQLTAWTVRHERSCIANST